MNVLNLTPKKPPRLYRLLRIYLWRHQKAVLNELKFDGWVV